MTKKQPTCKYCWDKGYSTQIRGQHFSADFIGDKEYNTPPKVEKNYCTRCEKGRKMGGINLGELSENNAANSANEKQRKMVEKTDHTAEASEKVEDWEKRVDEIIDNQLGLNDKDGSYLFHLTRCKSAFEVGTMTLDDFVEIDCDDEWANDTKYVIKNLISQERQRMKEEFEKILNTFDYIGGNDPHSKWLDWYREAKERLKSLN